MTKKLAGILAALLLVGCATTNHGPVHQRVDRQVLLAYKECDDKILYFTFVEEVPTEAVKQDTSSSAPSMAGWQDLIGGVAEAAVAEAVQAFTEVAKAGYEVRKTTIGNSAEFFAAGWDSEDDMEHLEAIIGELSILSRILSYSRAVAPGALTLAEPDSE